MCPLSSQFKQLKWGKIHVGTWLTCLCCQRSGMFIDYVSVNVWWEIIQIGYGCHKGVHCTICWKGSRVVQKFKQACHRVWGGWGHRDYDFRLSCPSFIPSDTQSEFVEMKCPVRTGGPVPFATPAYIKYFELYILFVTDLLRHLPLEGHHAKECSKWSLHFISFS